eukprot:5402392-Prymnesium_polylepis.1
MACTLSRTPRAPSVHFSPPQDGRIERRPLDPPERRVGQGGLRLGGALPAPRRARAARTPRLLPGGAGGRRKECARARRRRRRHRAAFGRRRRHVPPSVADVVPGVCRLVSRAVDRGGRAGDRSAPGGSWG